MEENGAFPDPLSRGKVKYTIRLSLVPYRPFDQIFSPIHFIANAETQAATSRSIARTGQPISADSRRTKSFGKFSACHCFSDMSHMKPFQNHTKPEFIFSDWCQKKS